MIFPLVPLPLAPVAAAAAEASPALGRGRGTGNTAAASEPVVVAAFRAGGEDLAAVTAAEDGFWLGGVAVLVAGLGRALGVGSALPLMLWGLGEASAGWETAAELAGAEVPSGLAAA
jgi:hypothetical protein